ncbi:nicotinate-nucleotide--dimethylbenzimidazole phosphoribosyltransferase [Cohnella caldifontis]|uniref:nicotinate-nucleotide--dimethylbenzimidazole phosphoribosyltransferase n=1 Tax=Cohnella caldifontis TaxID=3027471 RepID=UPI0023ED5D72|nr:nicotinate-nucleotide--dimethylbenzimidazole phosphoribosyltransferase [Cohnella sp. YIM B05605]
MNELNRTLAQIATPDESARQAAARYLDTLTKPPGSLGRLEELAVQLAGITGELRPDLAAKAVVVMAADHGVCEEGVSAFPQEVTAQMVMNFLGGGAAINVLARQAGAAVFCVDIGVKAELSHEALRVRKVRPGTANIARGPAMSREEAARAIEAGIAVARELAGQGFKVLATGEMGIGNTTPSAAMMAVLCGIDAEHTVGRGTGVDDAGVERKRDVIRRAIACNAPDAGDPLDVLGKLGGLDIAGLTGLILGAAAERLPIVVDGFISTVAALTAVRLAPQAIGYLIPSHLSQEQGHRLLLERLGLAPMLDMRMRLGEGTGAALAFPLLDAAVSIMREMATFESAGVSGGPSA